MEVSHPNAAETVTLTGEEPEETSNPLPRTSFGAVDGHTTVRANPSRNTSTTEKNPTGEPLFKTEDKIACDDDTTEKSNGLVTDIDKLDVADHVSPGKDSVRCDSVQENNNSQCLSVWFYAAEDKEANAAVPSKTHLPITSMASDHIGTEKMSPLPPPTLAHTYASGQDAIHHDIKP